jgi:hypothetical protein
MKNGQHSEMIGDLNGLYPALAWFQTHKNDGFTKQTKWL